MRRREFAAAGAARGDVWQPCSLAEGHYHPPDGRRQVHFQDYDGHWI